MIRATTNGVLKSYKNNLMSSFITLNSARNRVLTGRNFISYAEDPAAAAQSFQLRRSFSLVGTQFTNNTAAIHKFETAWSSLDSVSKAIDAHTTGNSAWKEVLAGVSDTSGAGRAPLGKSLINLADNITQTMNAKYGDNFVFAGADGKNVPFTWVEDANGVRQLHYRGVPVDALDNTDDLEKLEVMSEEDRFVDIGLGMKEDANGNLVESSAFNDALHGINILGYGVDADGDPKNVVSIINQMGNILSRCSDDGTWANDQDKEDFQRLSKKFEEASASFKEEYVAMDTKAEFLKNNEKQLKTTADTLNSQIVGIENVDPAEAISSFIWAQYSYNAALKVGNSILSQSLMDYLR